MKEFARVLLLMCLYQAAAFGAVLAANGRLAGQAAVVDQPVWLVTTQVGLWSGTVIVVLFGVRPRRGNSRGR